MSAGTPGDAGAAGVEVRGLTRRFGAAAALHGVDLSVGTGEFVALLGPSGSGKTTLLRILAGLETADAGHVAIGGRDVAGTAPGARGIGFVFQHYALFRHMTVFENVAFGLRVRPRARRPARQAVAARVRELLALVQLPELERRYPDQLSGGQRQRVALARALAVEPRTLLLDEPFGALDAQVRKELRRWLRGLHERLALTSVIVTHDQDEAMELADRVAVMRGGRIVQYATPDALLADPADAFVAGFLGDAARLPCAVRAGTAAFGVPGLPDVPAALPDGPAVAFLRPRDVVARPDAGGPGRIDLAREDGRGLRLTVTVGGATLEAVPDAAWPAPRRGDPCALAVLAARVFPAGEGA